MNMTQKIDELGILVKEIAQREAAARAIKAELIALGPASTRDFSSLQRCSTTTAQRLAQR
jgi:hypothetical protein